VTLIGLIGVERNKGNMRTALVDPTSGQLIRNDKGNEIYSSQGVPLNQYGYSYGLGLDFDFNGRAGLYVRQRWFYFQDVNQFLDGFSGTESTVELKIFF
jgi:hypothetical protein